MTGASVLYYGRRNRAARTPTDFGFSSSSSDRHRARSGEAAATAATTSARRDRLHLHARGDQHASRSHSGEFGEFGRSSSFRLQPCSLEGIALDSRPLQLRGGDAEAPVQNTVHGDTMSCGSDGVDCGQRLPRSVLLAKERLLQRLRGLPPPYVRQDHESGSSSHSNDHWPNNFGNTHISVSSGHMAESSFVSPATTPLTLSREEDFASCRRAVFTEAREDDGSPDFCVSDECCICLEQFKDGNELTCLPCGHRFHSSCLTPWIQSYGNCPFCRSGISTI